MAQFKLNGQDVEVDAPEEAPLLFVLRNDLGLNGAKFGCGRKQCGACTVMVDDAPVESCTTPFKAVIGRSVTTVEGLLENGEPGPLQKAFITEQAAQCGYCAAGILISAQALLDRNPKPTESEVRSALDGNLCRCGTHNRFVRAVLRAAEEA